MAGDKTLEEKIEKVRVQLVFNHPFFSALVLNLQNKVYETKDNPHQVATAAVDGKYIYYCREWCDKLTVDELMGVIIHETLHVAHSHILPWRRGWRQPDIWNMAGDYVVNGIIDANGMKLPKEVLLDKKYADMSTEEVYRELEAKADKIKVPGSSSFFGDLRDPSKEGEGGEGGGKGGNNPGNGSGRPLTEAEQREMEQDWNNRLVDAAVSARQQGKAPAGMDRILDEITNPRIPWHAYLDNLVGEVLRDDYAFERPDRRFLQQGIYLPDLYNEGAMVAVVIDTSGSIGQEEMGLFLSEALGILASKNVTRIRLMCCDAKVTFDKYLTPNSPIPSNLPGGGGTDFRPPFSRINRAQEKPQMVIYLTDLCGTFPEEPEYPVIWVAHNNGDSEAPFGTQINFDPSKDEMEVFSAGKGNVNPGMDFDEYTDNEEEDVEEYQGETA
jgi:predicted metal-dependent peptidase